MTANRTLLVEDLDHFESARIRLNALQNCRIIVTGGTGFVGSWLLEAILHLNRSRNLQVQAWIVSRNPDRWLQTRPHLATDPCIHIIRLYEDDIHKKAVEANHEPSTWRATNRGIDI